MTLTMTEYPNVDALKQVLKLPFINKGDRPALEAYLKLAESNAGAVNIHYSQRYYNGNPYGRYYPDLKVAGQSVRTAQGQWRNVRSALFADTETDIDIVNCHPTIISNICKMNRISSPQLDSYVANRDQFILDNIKISQDDVDRYNVSTSNVWTIKDLAKAVVSATLYGCSDFKKEFKLHRPPFRDTKFKLEIKRITKAVISLPKYTQLVSDIRTSQPDAHDGTFMSFILQEEERQIVELAMKVFIEHGFTITTLIHDGFHVNSTDKAGIDSILQLINTDVAPLRFIRKPFAESVLDIDMECRESSLVCPETEYFDPQAFDSIVDREDGVSSAEEIKCKQRYMDMFFSIVDNPSCIARRTPHGYEVLKIPNFEKLYKCLHYYVRGPFGPKCANFLTYWQENPYSPRYVSMYWEPYTIHRPSGRPGLNTFTKFKHAVIDNFQVNQALIEPMLFHIREVLSDGNIKVNEFILNFFAAKVQNPAHKVCVSLVFKSVAEGAGKNTATEFFSNNVIGDEFTRSFANLDSLLNNFNADAAQTVLTVLDEIGANGASMKNHNAIKDLITRQKQAIERKGFDRTSRNGDYNDYILTSNDDWIIRVSESDRRVLCSEVSGKYVGDSTYFKNLYAHQNDTVGLHFFHYLLQRDISEFDINKIPITDWKRSLKVRSYTPWIKTVISILKMPSDSDGIVKVSSSHLLDIFNSVCRDVEKLNSVKSFNSSFVKYTLWDAPTRFRNNGDPVTGFVVNKSTVLNTCRRILKDPEWEPMDDEITVNSGDE